MAKGKGGRNLLRGLPKSFSLLTSHFLLLLLLGIPGRERDPAGKLPVETDLERVLPGTGEGNVEDQHRAGLDVDHSGGRLAELYRALTTEELVVAVINKPDADGVGADLGAPAPDPEHEVGPGVDRREVREPYVLKHAEHAELALLIDEGVIGDHGEIEVQGSGNSNGRNDVVLLDLVHHIHALDNLPEDGVHSIEVRLR